MNASAPPHDASRILIVDDDAVIRQSLKTYLERYHQGDKPLSIVVVEDAQQARNVLAAPESGFDLVISDINMPDETGFDFLNDVKARYPGVRVALITAYQVDDYIRQAKETGIFNVIAKSSPFDFDELSSVVNALLSPESAFGLAHYLTPGTPLTETILKSSHEIFPNFEKLRSFFGEHDLRHKDDLATALIEALTNAVYHAVRLPDGRKKYTKGQIIESLPPEEWVSLKYGCDAGWIGVSITDQGGGLRPEDVLYWIERHMSGSGLMDTHGRGVYLIHTLVDRLIVNIQTQQRTELIILHALKPGYKSQKPIYINVY